ncbi:PAS domain-containing protein [Geopsychrobacter electrodiphilus]|uniref:PAS domain-containing protein n=1 Tax=Geopsychrobacter electrodiphilus TaxID=225196 RepID=UPI000361DCE5|nr:PAS domain S-box protein [Geopsychrobacter electrodiphilus]
MFPEKLSQQIIQNAPDAILYVDSKGLIQHWNQGSERIFGFTASEAVGQSLDIIIPEKLRGRHWEGYYKVMASGESRYGTELLSVPALHRDGQRLSVDFSIIMLKDDQGKVTGIASLMRDVTAQRQKEKELRERIAALEGQ